MTKNPKEIGKDIKRGIQKNTPDLPDLSELPNLTKQPNFFKGEGEVNATNEVKNKVCTTVCLLHTNSVIPSECSAEPVMHYASCPYLHQSHEHGHKLLCCTGEECWQ